MPLDHIRGEPVEGYDDFYVVAPFERYAEQTRLTAEVEETTGKQFKRKVRRQRPVVEIAMNYAAEAFAKKGLGTGGNVDILVQQYPASNVLMFLFCANIAGTDYYVTAPFKLSDQQVADLTLRGIWTPLRLN